MIKERRMEAEAATTLLVGHRIVDASSDTLWLDNGTQMRFEHSITECCSQVRLVRLAATENIITAATVADDEHATGGEGAYRAWIQVVTEAGEFRVAEADGDAGTGYYLHGFALGVTVKAGYRIVEEP